MLSVKFTSVIGDKLYKYAPNCNFAMLEQNLSHVASWKRPHRFYSTHTRRALRCHHCLFASQCGATATPSVWRQHVKTAGINDRPHQAIPLSVHDAWPHRSLAHPGSIQTRQQQPPNVPRLEETERLLGGIASREAACSTAEPQSLEPGACLLPGATASREQRCMTMHCLFRHGVSRTEESKRRIIGNRRAGIIARF